MRKIFLTSFTIFTLLGFCILSCNDAGTKNESAPAAVNNDSLIKRGSYMVSVMGCDDCHSPKKMTDHGPEVDQEKRFSGYPAGRPFPKIDSNLIKTGMVVFAGDLLAAAGPWGVSFAANISSDETGIGNWKLENFKKALREGKTKGLDGARPILPPMPWQDFKNLTDDDIAAIFAFLKSTKPISNVVPAPKQLNEL